MKTTPPAPAGRRPWKGIVLSACLLAAFSAPRAAAQGDDPAVFPALLQRPAAGHAPDGFPLPAEEPGAIIPAAGCAGCGVPPMEPFPQPCDDGCGSHCVPGRTDPCCAGCCDHGGVFGRAYCGLYEALCCPDPCYEPRWVAAANSAFFLDSPRPVTHLRLRWDHGEDMIFPDRAEYFWARIGGPGPQGSYNTLRYDELHIYTETAIDKFAFFIDVPYRSWELTSSLNPAGTRLNAAGFGDLSLGTKSVLLDSELLLVTFQFTTYIPTGAAGRGLGVQHVSLEPALLSAVKMTRDTYVQGQLAEWIPISGRTGFESGILQYRGSFNHVLARPKPDVELIGTLEGFGYSFHTGGFTDRFGLRQRGSGDTYFYIGPGIRCVLCDKMDIGFGAAFAVTDEHFADQIYRTEFRWRY
ncbi:MAG TPA: hypothetical protein VIL46_06860 [Gemmataceae bacterium]